MLSDVICETFEKHIGRRQLVKPEKQAMRIEFRTKIDHDTEEGYRYADMIIYAPMNYVQVWVRTRWCVIPVDDLECDSDHPDDVFVKKGKDYTEGASEWKLIGDHDSCWRDSVLRFLTNDRNEIQGFSSIRGWYSIINPPLTELVDKSGATAA